jgi:hypothetical protein
MPKKWEREREGEGEGEGVKGRIKKKGLEEGE